MKLQYYTLIFSLLWVSSVWAHHSEFLIDRTTIKYQGDQRDCWSASIDSHSKTVKKAWKDFIEEDYQAQVQGIGFLSNKKVLTVEAGRITDISTKPVDLFLKVTAKGSQVSLALFARDHQGDFISRSDSPDEFKALKPLLTRFIRTHLINQSQQRLESWKTQYQELTERREDKLETLEENKEDIRDAQETILELNEENDQLMIEIQEIENEIENAGKRVEEEKLKLNKIRIKKTRS